VGLSGLPEPGDCIEAGESLAVVHAADDEHWRRAAAELEAAMTIAAERPEPVATVLERVRSVTDED